MPIDRGFNSGHYSGTSAGTSFSLTPFPTGLNDLTIVAIAIAVTSVSVTSISDSLGGVYTLRAAQNGSAVRTELWTAPCTAAGLSANTPVVTLSGSSLACAVASNWYGLTTWTFGNTMSATGTDYVTLSSLTIQDQANMAVCAVGFVNPTGFTATANFGLINQQVVPSVSSVGVVLMDGGYTNATGPGYEVGLILGGLSENWAQAGVELRTTLGSAAIADYTNTIPLPITPIDINVVVPLLNVYLMPLREAAALTGNSAY